MEKPKKRVTKPPPVVRQTKTSIYRLAQANPLLVQENQIQVADKSVHLPEAVVHGRVTLDEIQFRRWIHGENNKSKSGKLSLGSSVNLEFGSKILHDFANTKSKPLQSKPTFVKNIPSIYRSKENEAQPKKTLVQPKSRLMVKNNVLKPSNVIRNEKPVVQIKPSIKTLTQPPKFIGNKQVSKPASKSASIVKPDIFKKPTGAVQKKPIRRSISSEHFVKNKTIKTNLNTSSSSLDNFSKFMDYRNTVSATSTPLKLVIADTTLSKLQNPLREWLSGRNKSLSNYQHLKCFGLQGGDNDIKLEDEDPEGTSENSEIIEVEDNEVVNENIVMGAIDDLHNLIVTGYPIQQCEAWLDYIKSKYKKIVELPQYWECRAAIEQGRGDITRAIECYQNSIVNGANVDQIDESLGQLLSKFSLLNIDSNTTPNIKKKRNENEGNNLFKSTIIQFAIKERSLNINDKAKNPEDVTRFIGTPVRRSTRKSGVFKHTPGKMLYDSWTDVDNSIKENIEFKSNAFL